MFEEPLVKAPHLVVALMTVTIMFAYAIESLFKWAKRVGAVIIIITLGIILGNLNVVTQNSPVYHIISTHIIPVSISLLLLRLNLKSIKELDKGILLYFLIGSLGTIAGAVVTFLILGGYVGDEAWKLSGQLTSSYIGGGENAVAVGHYLGVARDYFTAAFAADNVVTALWMLVCLSAPIGFTRFFATRLPESEIEKAKEVSEPFAAYEIVPSVFYSLSAASIIVVLSDYLTTLINKSLIKGEGGLDFPSILLVTTLSLILAQTPLRRYFKVSYLLGVVMFNYFFFTMGAISSVSEVLRIGPSVFVFVATVVIVHAVVVFVVGKLIKADLPRLLIASQACIGGPSTACALAEANEWPHLVAPGILLGVLGYAIGNYAGIGVAFFIHNYLM